MNRTCYYRIPVVAMLLTLAGCIVVPVASKNPYPPEVLKQFSQQGANRDLVRQTLGAPQATKSAGKYWFYYNSRNTAWYAGVLTGRPAAWGISLFEWVMVEFDDSDRVVFYEFSNKDDGCLSNGVCLADHLSAVTAPRVQDAAAKSYQARNDECAVYVFLEPLPFWEGISQSVSTLTGNLKEPSIMRPICS